MRPQGQEQMAKSSVNFEKAKQHSDAHNTREDEPDYLLPPEHRLQNEYWKHTKPEVQIFQESKAKQKTGKPPRLENSRWEGVLNFNKNHTLEDIQKVAAHIEKKFNITCTSIAMHKDEGHINERGIVEYNLHAHLNFITHKDGRQNWRREFIQIKHLRELQTEVAELLGMERGTDKRISKVERLDHKAYKAMIQKQQAIIQEYEEKIQRVQDDAMGYEREQEKTMRLEKKLEELHLLNEKKEEKENYKRTKLLEAITRSLKM